MKTNQLRWSGVVRSEWIKLRSHPGTVLTLLGTLALVVLLSALVCWAQGSRWDEASSAERALFDPVRASLAGVFLAQLTTGVVGVLVSAGEHTSGLARATYAVVPRRLWVLSAKVAVLAAATFAVSLVAVTTSFVLGQELLEPTGRATTFQAEGVTRAVLGAAAYLTGVAVLGLALGTLLRSVAGAVSAVVVLLLVLPLIVVLLPAEWTQNLLPYLPGNAGQAMMQVRENPFNPAMSPGRGGLLFMGYIAALLAAAGDRLVHRDV